MKKFLKKEFYMKKVFLGLVLSVLSVLTISSAYANNYNLILGTGVGGTTDIIARHVAAELNRIYPNDTFTVKNVLGANSVLAIDSVKMTSNPDEDILVVATAFISNTELISGKNFNPVEDFVHFPYMLVSPQVMIVNTKKIPNISVLLNSNLNFKYGASSKGGAPWNAGEVLKKSVPSQLTYISYQGAGTDQTVDLVNGDLDFIISTYPAAVKLLSEHPKASIAPVAITKKMNGFNVETFKAQKLGNVNTISFYGFVANKNMSKATQVKIQQGLLQVFSADFNFLDKHGLMVDDIDLIDHIKQSNFK